MRATIRAFGTDCAVTNTTISYADGRTKETLLNGVVKTAYEYGPNWTKTYEGPAGLDSPRWSCSYEDALGRTIAEVRPGFRGALLITSNEYNTANQLVATRSYAIEQSEQSNNRIFSSTLICYNNCGERTLTVSDMNLNSQIDWSDTDRIVSNDTRYVSLNGDWWRESSTWQTRQNGSPALTRVGLTRTRLTGLANNGDERLANNGEYPPTAQRSPEGAATLIRKLGLSGKSVSRFRAADGAVSVRGP